MRPFERIAVGLGFALALALEGGAPHGARAPQRTPSPSLLGDDALARLQRRVAEREYWPRAGSDGAVQAANRAHDLRTLFESTGIRVHDRSAAGSPELLRLSLAGLGRGAALAPPPAGREVVPREGRVEIRRAELVEWYENSAAGLEQGFTLAARPPGAGPLVLELAVAGACARARGDAVELRSEAGRTLAYGGLVARDARGAELVARLEAPDPARIRIVVDDERAEYPLVIDPLLTESADATLQSTSVVTQFGTSVASAGDVNGDGYADVIVGAPFAAGGGAAYVFHGGPTGVASGAPADADATLISDQFASMFGQSAASAGDVNGDGYGDVIVGAHFYDAGQGFGEGAAFVFLGSASGIASGDATTASARLESDQATVGGNAPALGVSVASAGDVNGDGYSDVIVGAPGYDAGQGAGEGVALVFLGSASGIASGSPATADAVLESNQGDGRLGQSVASAGDVNGDGYDDVIVGASSYDEGTPNEGAAFVFLGRPSGVADGSPATAAATLESNQAAGGGGNAPAFGASVASAGDVNGDGYADVIVGAPSYDNGQLDEGAAFAFLGGASGVASANPTTAHAVFESNQLGPLGGGAGSGVASAGDVNGDGYADVIVGVRYYSDGHSLEGAAAVFLGSASGLASGTPDAAYALLEVNQTDAYFGSSVAGAGDLNGDGYADVIAGAPYYDIVAGSDAGEALVYLGGGIGIVDGSDASAVSLLPLDRVAPAGDVNGDGYDDVLVSTVFPGFPPQLDYAFVYYGSPTGVEALAPTVLSGVDPDASFGSSIAAAGDVNGDGYGDVLVGANEHADGQTDEGAAFLFLGGASGIPDGDSSSAAARLETDQAGAVIVEQLTIPWLSVASAGDVNGDGYGDVLVGAPGYDSPETDEGAAFLFLGSASGIASGGPGTAAAVFQANQVGAAFGLDVASAGDVNGDGYGDVVTTALLYDSSETDEGGAFVFLGSAAGIASGDPATANAVIQPNVMSSITTYARSAGDVDGDGYGDLIVARPAEAMVFLGGASGIPSGSPTTADAILDFDEVGEVDSAGDVNGDGYADVIVGNPDYDGGEANEGAAFVFLGSASGVASGDGSTASAVLESNFGGLRWGEQVAGLGDVNGDGYADVSVTSSGAGVAVFLGNGNQSGRPQLARQQRGDGSFAPVQPWGASHANGRFGVEIAGSHPEGSGRVRPEYEACPPGVPFGDASCTSALYPTWVSVGGAQPEATLALNLVGLAPNTLQRWRVRMQLAPATGPLPANPAHGPWRRPTAQGREADVRAVPEPGLALQLGVALAALALRARLRRRAPRSQVSGAERGSE